MNITRNFTTEELHLYVFHPLSDYTNVLLNLSNLCINVLQPTRDYFGNPITITSGYRDMILNVKVGGVRNSQHLLGEAVDFICDNIEDVYHWMCKSLIYDQLILEEKNGMKWIHVSLRRVDFNRMDFF